MFIQGFVLTSSYRIYISPPNSPQALARKRGRGCRIGVFKELYTIDFSCQGSNNRNREEDVVYCFEVFLTDLEDRQVNQLSLEELMIFITGSDVVPHLGFERQITIQFMIMMKVQNECPGLLHVA